MSSSGTTSSRTDRRSLSRRYALIAAAAGTVSGLTLSIVTSHFIAKESPETEADVQRAAIAAAKAREADEDPEAARRKHHDEHEASLKAHAEESVDPAWAPAEAEILREGLLKSAADGAYRVVDVDCRSRSCTAVVEFGSHTAAEQDWKRLLYTPLESHCGSSVWIGDPDESIPYRTTVVFDCKAS